MIGNISSLLNMGIPVFLCQGCTYLCRCTLKMQEAIWCFLCVCCGLTMMLCAQVATRFLSVSPPIYWYAAHVMDPSVSGRPMGRLIWAIFFSYLGLGSLLFINFYPFTWWFNQGMLHLHTFSKEICSFIFVLHLWFIMHLALRYLWNSAFHSLVDYRLSRIYSFHGRTGPKF